MEEDPLRLQLTWEGFKNQHFHFSPSYDLCFIPTSAGHFSVALNWIISYGGEHIPKAVKSEDVLQMTCSGKEVKTALTEKRDPTEPALTEKTWLMLFTVVASAALQEVNVFFLQQLIFVYFQL